MNVIHVIHKDMFCVYISNIQFNSVNFRVIYIEPNHSNSPLKTLYNVKEIPYSIEEHPDN